MRRGWAAWAAMAAGLLVSAATAAAADGTAPRMLGVYDSHACVLRMDATVWCWGTNRLHELADGTDEPSRDTPVQAQTAAGPLINVGVLASTGYDHTCAIKLNGTVRCWGYNDDGQLGNGSAEVQSYPVTVLRSADGAVLDDVTALGLGEDHSCALRADRSVWCWGDNEHGKLGDGTTVDHPAAVRVRKGTGYLKDVRSIGGGIRHICAVVGRERSLWCWGDNTGGKLGDGTTIDRHKAVRVRLRDGGSLTGVVSVEGGRDHTCASRSDGTAWCWGDDTEGVLGNGTGGSSAYPVRVRRGGGFLSGVRSIDSGYLGACATTTADTGYCWGPTFSGQLGIGPPPGPIADRATRIRRDAGSSLRDIRSVRLGDSFGCALIRRDEVWCWGYGAFGQMGNGTSTEENYYPVKVSLP